MNKLGLVKATEVLSVGSRIDQLGPASPGVPKTPPLNLEGRAKGEDRFYVSLKILDNFDVTHAEGVP